MNRTCPKGELLKERGLLDPLDPPVVVEPKGFYLVILQLLEWLRERPKLSALLTGASLVSAIYVVLTETDPQVADLKDGLE